MRKLNLQTQVSIDGFMAGPNGEMDWLTFNWDEKLLEFTANLTHKFDQILLGKNLAGGFVPTWKESASKPEAQWFDKKMNETPKVVFSNTLKESPWERTTLATRSLIEEVSLLKSQSGGDIIAYGGAKFVNSLIEANLIDDYYLFVNPVWIGKGMPVFNSNEKKALNLVESLPFSCGITVLHYQPKG